MSNIKFNASYIRCGQGVMIDEGDESEELYIKIWRLTVTVFLTSM